MQLYEDDFFTIIEFVHNHRNSRFNVLFYQMIHLEGSQITSKANIGWTNLMAYEKEHENWDITDKMKS